MQITWRRRAEKSRRCEENWPRRREPRAAEIRLSHAPNRTGNVARMAAGLAFTASLLVAPGATRAQHLGNDTIALFPKNVGEFAYANLKQARTQKWFPQLQEQM